MADAPESPAQQAALWSVPILTCRDIGHAWERRSLVFAEQGRVVIRLWDCLRCTTRRLESIERLSGLVLKRGYVYPDGYSSRAGRVSKALVRSESLTRDWRARHGRR